MVTGKIIKPKEFIGRLEEIQYLERTFREEGSALLVVYGNYGVGKTRILQEFCAGKQSCYYLARSCSDLEQRMQWSREVQKNEFTWQNCPSYTDVFEDVLPEAQEKQVLIIDEFHSILKEDSSFFEELLNFLKRKSQKEGILAILCTSATGFVENSMVKKMGNAASEITGFLKIRELPLGEMHLLFPRYSFEDALKMYAVLGGNPLHWMCFSEYNSFEENVIQNLLAPESYLYLEMQSRMERELREVGVYNTILATLSSGSNKLNDLFLRSGYSRAKISVYLKNLMDLGLVEKIYPAPGTSWENSQKGIYRIESSLLRFFYHYLFPHQTLLEQLDAAEFYEKIILPDFERFVEESYCAICRNSAAAEFGNCGEWLGKDGNLDVVCKMPDGNYMAACCICRRQATDEDYLWLLYAAKKAGLRSPHFRLYAEQGYSLDLVTRIANEELEIISLNQRIV